MNSFSPASFQLIRQVLTATGGKQVISAKEGDSCTIAEYDSHHVLKTYSFAMELRERIKALKEKMQQISLARSLQPSLFLPITQVMIAKEYRSLSVVQEKSYGNLTLEEIAARVLRTAFIPKKRLHTFFNELFRLECARHNLLLRQHGIQDIDLTLDNLALNVRGSGNRKKAYLVGFDYGGLFPLNPTNAENQETIHNRIFCYIRSAWYYPRATLSSFSRNSVTPSELSFLMEARLRQMRKAKLFPSLCGTSPHSRELQQTLFHLYSLHDACTKGSTEQRMLHARIIHQIVKEGLAAEFFENASAGVY